MAKKPEMNGHKVDDQSRADEEWEDMGEKKSKLTERGKPKEGKRKRRASSRILIDSYSCDPLTRNNGRDEISDDGREEK